MIIEGILNVVQSLLGLRGQFLREKRDRRDRVADYLSEFGDVLTEAAAALRQGNVPHGCCGQLGVLAERFPGIAGDVLGQDEAMELAQQLMNAHEIERVMMELQQVAASATRDQQLDQLEEASGQIKGMAAALRAAP